ncbi:hypothetical protein I302_100002 [Kwoniella bestiolae CBS 10118]|uniref:Aminotransferase class V domain-containing protein n=1 Tax=Kwoniella bestiolae CBS 10118 TaxID=1296100 RepID=A0A1B9G3W4_9TREE|nr:hypothetical protein I302_03374 [Kwoniella bestiolae CBS 10118]OCF25701.1 hypothetical protein I302_03374 [Kwoniella bestiolae CBS 10118]
MSIHDDQSLLPLLGARQDFPLFHHRPDILYLNASFQQPLSKPVHVACTSFLDSHLYEPNPKAAWQEQVEKTRDEVAKLINAPKTAISFSKNTSEAMGMFIQALRLNKGDNVVILEDEHPNQVYAWLALENCGIEVRRVPAVECANADTFAPAVDSRTRVIGLSYVMFHSGQRNDVASITNRFRPQNIEVLVDATQAIGVLSTDSSLLNVSALAFSCHKAMGTPSGLGVLYVDPAILSSLVPRSIGPFGVLNLPETFIAGKDTSQLRLDGRRFETGNFNYLAIHALQAYIDLINRYGGQAAIESMLYKLSQRLIDKMADLGIPTVAKPEQLKRSPHNVVFPLLNPGWPAFFSSRHVLVSHYRAGTRVSIGIYNNEDDIDRFVGVVKEGMNSIPLN